MRRAIATPPVLTVGTGFPRIGMRGLPMRWQRSFVFAVGAGPLLVACRADPESSFSGPDTGASGAPSEVTASDTEVSSVPPRRTAGSTSGAPMGSTDEGSDDDAADTIVRFDLGMAQDHLPACAQGGPEDAGALDFSYIWIANSLEGTVSKIDTETLLEVGRYRTRPDGAGDPSRTSVNLNGDVAVANRRGGITMIAARREDCPDPENTSIGPGDVRPWPDGCVLWHAPFQYDSQRPVAWTHGQWNPQSCRYEGQSLWTSGHDENTSTADVLLLRERDGAVEQTALAEGVATDVYGLYGGAVDGQGNFWATGLGASLLHRVELATMDVTAFDNPVNAYGITVDHEGFVWTCDTRVSRFSPAEEDFVHAAVDETIGHWGCMEDGEGILWVSGAQIVGIDIHTLEIVHTLAVPTSVRGISLDARGRVWGPSFEANVAYSVDPQSGEVETVRGLQGPYTYSDMTGYALRNVFIPAG